MEIVPEANFGIEQCKNGTPERNAIILATEVDYMLMWQTTMLPKMIHLFLHMNNTNNVGIVKE